MRRGRWRNVPGTHAGMEEPGQAEGSSGLVELQVVFRCNSLIKTKVQKSQTFGSPSFSPPRLWGALCQELMNGKD